MEAGGVSGVAPEVWSKLSATSPSGDSLTARLAVPTLTERLLAAIDADGRRHLLIPLRSDDADFRDVQSRGVTVTTRELTVRGRDTARYLDLECHDVAGYEAFDLIGSELADGLESDNAMPANLVARVLAKWRRFWGQLPGQILSREEQLGLFAELWFLSIWLIPRIGATKALEGWRGPLGARHDFEWPGKSIEVKATTSTRGRIHRINGLDQLNPPENGELLFFSLRLREEGGATNTLPSLIASIRIQLKENADDLNQFELSLAHVGYLPTYEEVYGKLRLRVIDSELFLVAKDFPRIVSTSFATGVPTGIERVDYEINLSGIEKLRLASKPEHFPV